MRQRRGREDRRFGGEVEPLGQSAENEFGKGAAAQPGVNMRGLKEQLWRNILHVIKHRKLCIDHDIDIPYQMV